MAGPLVAVVTPSFNREDLVAETLDSIVAQTYPHWENIVVDDGSTDGTKGVVAAYAAREPRIRLFDRSREPKGACTCRNEGVSLSSAKYVMFLDTDDIIEPFCLAQRVAAMEARPELDLAIFPSLMFEATPHDLGLWWNIEKPEDELSRQFRQDAICQGTGVLWRKDAFERIGMWDESLVLWQDIDLFFRAFIQGYRYAKFFDLRPDLHNRVTPTSLSRGSFHSPAKTASRAQVVRRAVALLRANGMDDRAPEARFMTAEIISGAARSNQISLALELVDWGVGAGVFAPVEGRRLTNLVRLHQVRLASRPGFRRWVARVLEHYRAETTLGQLSTGSASSAASEDRRVQPKEA